MLRGSRCIILALVGLILLGAGEPRKSDAQPKQTTEQGEIAKSLQEISATLERAQQADETTKPCAPEQPNRNSDLCAQWKAADAASSAANAAWKQYYAALFGLLLGAITMAAAIAAAIYARRAAVATEDTVEIAKTAASEAGNALEIAERNAGAAVKLADQAEKTAERQLRAYLSVKSITFKDDEEWTDKEVISSPFLSLDIENNGQTPGILSEITIVCHWESENAETIRLLASTMPMNFECHKGPPMKLNIDVPAKFEGSETTGILFCLGNIRYADVFGKPRVTPFAFRTQEREPYADIALDTQLAATSIITTEDIRKEMERRKVAVLIVAEK